MGILYLFYQLNVNFYELLTIWAYRTDSLLIKTSFCKFDKNTSIYQSDTFYIAVIFVSVSGVHEHTEMLFCLSHWQRHKSIL